MLSLNICEETLLLCAIFLQVAKIFSLKYFRQNLRSHVRHEAEGQNALSHS